MKIAIYARFSTDHQDASSIEQQEYRCRRTAEARGWKVIAVYADHAKSGKSLDRPEMERLLADVRQRGGAGFDVIMVDDLSRLSRDLADTMSLVYRELPTCGVQLFDCTTGQFSDGAGARLAFGAMALVNDAYLQSVRTQTHRGLEHRARGGFATGGRLYGYRTVPEAKPTDPEHPRKVYEIDPEQAEVVRRIFSEYLAGKAPARIAKDLNAERVPAPLDDSARKKRIKGWAMSTVRALLRNPKYAGHWTWNARKFVSISGQRTRKVKKRDAADLVVIEQPALAIIDHATWTATEERIRARSHKGGGRSPSGGTRTYPLSGLLTCAVCGGGFQVYGSKKGPNDERWVQYHCATHKQKGDAACSNAVSVSEQSLLSAIQEALSSLLSSATFQRIYLAALTKALQARPTGSDEERAATEAVRTQEEAVARLVDAVATMGISPALASRLKAEEAALDALRKKLAKLRVRAAAVPPDTGAEEANGWLRALVSDLGMKDPDRLRATFARAFGPLVLTPCLEGYRVTGNIKAPEIRTGSGGLSPSNRSCGGRI